MVQPSSTQKPLKVGIITFHYAINYGAMLQAFALLDILRRSGHDAEIIDYRPFHARRFVLRALVRSRWRPVAMGRDYIKYLLFMKFMKRHLTLSPERFLNNADLGQVANRYDLVFTGSDQVWNNATFGFEPPYYLDFLNEKRTKLASYAPSAGSTMAWGEHSDTVSALLGRFDHLSARDNATADLVQMSTGRRPELVLDPTLIGRFDAIAEDRRACPEPYLLVYHVMQSPVIDRRAADLKAKFGLRTIAVGDTSDSADETHIAVSPSRWLGYIKHADMLVTHSFHGTIFAILFRTPFVVVPHKSGSMRLTDLLNRAGISDRLLTPDVSLEDLPQTFWELDFDAIHERLASAIASSRAYLNGVLATAAKHATQKQA